MTAQKSQSSLFLSYARDDDEPFARRLFDVLRREYTVWFDRESMPSRALMFLQEIREAICLDFREDTAWDRALTEAVDNQYAQFDRRSALVTAWVRHDSHEQALRFAHGLSSRFDSARLEAVIVRALLDRSEPPIDRAARLYAIFLLCCLRGRSNP